jgi:hypothetical protein
MRNRAKITSHSIVLERFIPQWAFHISLPIYLDTHFSAQFYFNGILRPWAHCWAHEISKKAVFSLFFILNSLSLAVFHHCRPLRVWLHSWNLLNREMPPVLLPRKPVLNDNCKTDWRWAVIWREVDFPDRVHCVSLWAFDDLQLGFMSLQKSSEPS